MPNHPITYLAGIVLVILSAAAGPATQPFSPAPAPAESFDVGTLHVDKFGAGSQTLILIPGLGSGPWAWFGTIDHFSPNYTIYAITLPGFDGRPSTSETPLFTVFNRDFWELLETKQIKNPIVIGHSLGGTLAINLAEEHPERLSGIIAVDGLPVFPSFANATPQVRTFMASQMAAMFASQSKSDELAAMENYMSTIGTNKPELVDATAKLESLSDPKALAAWTQEDTAIDLRPNLAKITIPFLELMPYDGEANQGFGMTEQQTLDFYKSLVNAAPRSCVEPVDHSRHFAMLDQPEAVYAAIEKFLASIHS